MPKPSVSVIVPVFNVEGYVAQCLDSLLVQELEDLEIIVVNDGSTDETLRVIEQYSQEHPSIRLISQPNQGLSAARNAAMEQVRGDYLGFVDGDDWVHPSMYSTLLSRAVTSRADLAIANGQLYNHETGELTPIQDFAVWAALKANNHSTGFCPRIDQDLFLLDTSACKRLYRRSFLRSLDFQFPPGKIFEDVPAHYKLLLSTDTVVLVDQPFYFYRINRPGRITARSDESLFQAFDVMNQVMKDLHELDADEAIWASYIWFQSWVLRWLKNQIDPEFSVQFDQQCVAISSKFKAGSHEMFRTKFEHDQDALKFVSWQVEGHVERPVHSR